MQLNILFLLKNKTPAPAYIKVWHIAKTRSVSNDMFVLGNVNYEEKQNTYHFL